MSLSQLLAKGEDYCQHKIFRINPRVSRSEDPRQGPFFEIKVSHLDENSELIMVQIINITASVLVKFDKHDKKFLEMINACISHELRNPLNAIKALNMEK